MRTALLIAYLLTTATALADTGAAANNKTPTDKGAAEKSRGAELARVNDATIYEADVDRTLSQTPGVGAADRANPLVRAGVLNQLIERQLLTEYLAAQKIAATPKEVDVEIARQKAELDRSKQSLDALLAKLGQTEADYRAELAWKLSWQRFLDKQLTDEALEAFFKAHQREFDGSQLHVQHILLRPAIAGDDSAIASLVKQADDIRQQILDKKITFEAAAAKYSAGPSREKGGDIGHIGRHGPMVEAFNKAAFSLGPDDISQPVITPFGVHLIRALSVKPGTKKWTDVRDQLRTVLAQHLFDETAKQQLGAAKVEFLTRGPHFKPGTTQLEQ